MRTKEEIDLLNILHKEVEDARGETGTLLWAADARDGALVRGLYLNDVMERRRRAKEEKRGWGWHWPYGDCAPPKPLCRLMIFFFSPNTQNGFGPSTRRESPTWKAVFLTATSRRRRHATTHPFS